MHFGYLRHFGLYNSAPCLSRALQLDVKLKNNIYYLVGKPSNAKKPMIYVGQTTNGFRRLVDHDRKKKFWTEAVYFMAEGRSFTRDILASLEKYAIQQVEELKRYSYDNDQNPQCPTTEEEQAEIEDFYQQICFYMAAFGYPLTDEGFAENESFVETESVKAEINNSEEAQHKSTLDIKTSPNPSSASEPRNKTKETESTSYPQEVKCHAEHPRRGVSAEGIFYPFTGRLKVQAGSLIDLSMEPQSQTGKDMRKKLLDSDDLVPTSCNGELYTLKTAVLCSSPTDAANFVFGSSRRGPTQWKDDSERSLKELFPKLFPG